MGTYRSAGAATPAQLVLGFGNLGDRSIQEGIAGIGGLLRRRALGTPAMVDGAPDVIARSRRSRPAWRGDRDEWLPEVMK